ncbi:TVP38/TMEM64 family protein [Labilithrix luteola]|nr:VTT domain-containing protein [Labilithrix luteola]
MAREIRHQGLRRVAGGVLLAAFVAFLWLVWNRGLLTSWQEHANPFVFFSAMAVLPIVGVPVSPLYVVAGVTFDTWIGLLGSLAALAVNLALSFWIARSGLRPHLLRLMTRTGRALPDLENKPDNALRFALFMKLAPGLPLSFKHYVIALAGVPFSVYFAVSFVVSGFYTAALVVLGESLLHHEIRRALVVAGVLVALTLLITSLQRRRRAAGGASDSPSAFDGTAGRETS